MHWTAATVKGLVQILDHFSHHFQAKNAVQLVIQNGPQDFYFFSIADYSFYVKSIATYAPPKVDINNSFLGSVVSGRVLLFVILIFY